MRWLPIEVVAELNRTLVAMTGERHFVRDRGLLESALARPQNAFAYGEDDIVVLAVRLMAGIAQAHAFEQGNKRTAFGSLRLFLHHLRNMIVIGSGLWQALRKSQEISCRL